MRDKTECEKEMDTILDLYLNDLKSKCSKPFLEWIKNNCECQGRDVTSGNFEIEWG